MSHCTANDAFSIVKDLTRNLSLLSTLNLDELYQDKGLNNLKIYIRKNLEKLKNECSRRLETLDIALQTLCALCDAHPDECVAFVSKWSLNEFLKLIEYATTEGIFIINIFLNKNLLLFFKMLAQKEN